jgi:DmsE family decaheme c-type cytochrome
MMKKFKQVVLSACLSTLLVSWAAFGADAPAAPAGDTSSVPAGEAPAAPAKAAGKDLILKGDAKCTGCHDEADEPVGRATMLELNPGVLAISTTRHGVKGDARTPSCTNCHGESKDHVNFKGKGKEKPPAPDRSFRKITATPAAERSAACLTCHKGDKRTHWEGSQHANNDVSCNSCHRVHAEHDAVRDKKTQAEVCFTCHKNERADTHKMSTHPITAGKVACSDCHNLHGSAGPKLLAKNTVNETCWTCHAEKRGPFLFEHQPVTEDCTNCHTPHGSNIAPLLKSRPPFMCQECHDGSHASQTPVGPNAAGYQGGLAYKTYAGAAQYPSKNNVGNACMNCHNMVHGSNSPAGGYLQR